MKTYTAILVILYCSSCTSQKHKPSATIPFDSMKVVVWDLFKADAYVEKYISKDSVQYAKQKSIELYETIFLIHKIDKKDFYKSCAYYLANPGKHKTLLDSIISMANSKSDTVTINNNSMKKDSTNTIIKNIITNKKDSAVIKKAVINIFSRFNMKELRIKK